MTTLMVEHATHSAMVEHVLERVGLMIGVVARSVGTRYGQFLASLTQGLSLMPDEVLAISGSRDFVEAHRRLATSGSGREFAVLDRLLWADVSRALVGLRVAERRRRQALAETDACTVCDWARERALAA